MAWLNLPPLKNVFFLTRVFSSFFEAIYPGTGCNRESYWSLHAIDFRCLFLLELHVLELQGTNRVFTVVMTVLRQLLLEGVLFLGHIVWVVTDVSRDISGFLVVANIVHYLMTSTILWNVIGQRTIRLWLKLNIKRQYIWLLVVWKCADGAAGHGRS